MKKKRIHTKEAGILKMILRSTNRYSISLNAEENARFLSLFEQLGMNVMAHFITACVFQKRITTIKVDKTAIEYYVRLIELFGQFRAVGINYNQVVKILYRNFLKKSPLISVQTGKADSRISGVMPKDNTPYIRV